MVSTIAGWLESLNSLYYSPVLLSGGTGDIFAISQQLIVPNCLLSGQVLAQVLRGYQFRCGPSPVHRQASFRTELRVALVEGN